MSASNLHRLVLARCVTSKTLGAVLLAFCLTFPPVGVGGHAGRQLAITIERVPGPPGSDTVTLRATTKNVSGHEVRIVDQNPLIDYALTVTDSLGSPVTLSKRGKEFFSKDRVGRWSRFLIVTLQPGETRVDTFAIDEFFEFARPGRYLIAVRREFQTAQEVDSSNTLDVVLK
jgi:hypothetical protein